MNYYSELYELLSINCLKTAFRTKEISSFWNSLFFLRRYYSIHFKRLSRYYILLRFTLRYRFTISSFYIVLGCFRCLKRRGLKTSLNNAVRLELRQNYPFLSAFQISSDIFIGTQRNIRTSCLSNFYLKQKHTWKGNKFGGFRVSANRFDLHRSMCVCMHLCLVWGCSLNPESSVGSINRQIDDLFRVSIDSRRIPRFDWTVTL